jgi:predicted GNAT family N-acyltransferase
MKICPYSPTLRPFFKKLNEEWLNKYFVVEPYDAALLENCEKEIIDKGGHIFFGELDGIVIGTYALLPPKNGYVEIGKMAITAEYQGNGYGQQLLKHAISKATTLGNKEMLLYSNRKLKNSIYIYRKFGFKEVPNSNSPYARGNIKMLLKL